MSDENQVNESNEQIESSTQERSIDPRAYEQVSNDMHKYKRQSMDLQLKMEEMQAKMKAIEEQKLQQSENYKELWEKEKNYRMEAEEKMKSFSKSVIDDKKMSAIREIALQKNINPEFIDLLDSFDTSDVVVETTNSGNFQVNGADIWVEDLLKARPSMFNRRVDPSINNGGTANSAPKEKFYSPAELLKLQKENPQKYTEVVMKQRSQIRK